MDIQQMLENQKSELRKKLNEEKDHAQRYLICAEMLQIDERLARLDK